MNDVRVRNDRMDNSLLKNNVPTTHTMSDVLTPNDVKGKLSKHTWDEAAA